MQSQSVVNEQHVPFEPFESHTVLLQNSLTGLNVFRIEFGAIAERHGAFRRVPRIPPTEISGHDRVEPGQLAGSLLQSNGGQNWRNGLQAAILERPSW